MSRPLDGVRVATLEHRYPAQLTQLLERQGATVLSCPLLQEAPVEDAGAAARFIALCESGAADYVVFFTGVGVDFLMRAVPRPEAFNRSVVLARGPKAVNALRRAGARIDLIAEAPTTEGIVATLAKQELAGKSVLVQLYGQENPELARALTERGARVTGISLYHYTPASADEEVARLIDAIVEGRVDAITFTTGSQIQFLLAAADRRGLAGALRDRLGRDVVIVSVGVVTARAIEDAGFKVAVMPEDPKMGPMVQSMATYFGKKKRAMYYPVFIDLEKRNALVIGGGAVAERKVESLVEAGARVTVVSPEVTPQLQEWNTAGRIVVVLRPFADGDVIGHFIVIAATDDPAAQRQARAACARHRVLINVVDQPELCDFIIPAITRRGDVIVAISTSGRSPALAAALRTRVEEALPADVARAASVLGMVREEARRRIADPAERKRAFERVVASGILDWIRDCDDAAALARVRQLMDLDAVDPGNASAGRNRSA